MLELKCPNCGEVFSVNEDAAASIIKQVRDKEFNSDIEAYKKHLDAEQKALKELLQKDSEAALKEAEAANNLKMAELKAELEKAASETELAIAKAVAKKEREIAELKAREAENASKSELALLNQKMELESGFAEKAKELTNELEKAKDEAAYYRDFRNMKSTKSIGEDLELHCERQFNTYLRPMLPGVYFEKDNEISETGSKGDYIYREERDGVEVLSIMFEMKNEMETTEVKHKNEYFFKELDKDRKEKKCEYAVLVSRLEADNEYYNQGICDVSYRFEKMYVIRPEMLIPLITLLRNAALNSFSYRKELADYQAQNIDVINFESKLKQFKDGFSKSCIKTQQRFDDAISQIDKAIKDLEAVKTALEKSGKHLTEADNKLEDLSVRKLTYMNPTMKKMFADAKLDSDED